MAKRKVPQYKLKAAAKNAAQEVARAREAHDWYVAAKKAAKISKWRGLGQAPLLVWGEFRASGDECRVLLNHLGTKGRGMLSTIFHQSCGQRFNLLHCAHILALELLLTEAPERFPHVEDPPDWVVTEIARSTQNEHRAWLSEWSRSTGKPIPGRRTGRARRGR